MCALMSCDVCGVKCALHKFGVLFFWFVCVLHVALYVLYVWCASGMCGCLIVCVVCAVCSLCNVFFRVCCGQCVKCVLCGRLMAVCFPCDFVCVL